MTRSPLPLSRQAFLAVVGSAPLVSIDLLVRDASGRLLVGRRVNPPAQGFWFVPGGRVRKGETLADAFERISAAELGARYPMRDTRFAGVFEHFYDEDFTGGNDAGGTHYVVLAYVLDAGPARPDLPVDQHDQYRWVAPAEGLSDPDIHANTRAYLELGGP